MNLYFVRHGESEANILNVFSNKGLKHGLTEKGREQVESLSEKLKDIQFEGIYSSPLLRAIETSEILSKKRNMNYTIAEELIEFDVGILEGKSDAESWTRFKNLFDAWLVENNQDMMIEAGESYHDVINRISPFIQTLKRKHSNRSNILLIGHGGTFKCAFPFILSNIDLAYSIGTPLKNTEYILAKLVNDQFVCIQWGENILETIEY